MEGLWLQEPLHLTLLSSAGALGSHLLSGTTRAQVPGAPGPASRPLCPRLHSKPRLVAGPHGKGQRVAVMEMGKEGRPSNHLSVLAQGQKVAELQVLLAEREKPGRSTRSRRHTCSRSQSHMAFPEPGWGQEHVPLDRGREKSCRHPKTLPSSPSRLGCPSRWDLSGLFLKAK